MLTPTGLQPKAQGWRLAYPGEETFSVELPLAVLFAGEVFAGRPALQPMYGEALKVNGSGAWRWRMSEP